MRESFAIVPAGSGPVWVFAALVVLFTAMLVLFGSLIYSSRAMVFEVSPEGLRITGGLYGRFVPAVEIDKGAARTVDLTRDVEYRLKWRTNGAGLPGFMVGWFRLNSGQKALAFVTDGRRVVYVPTRRGYAVMLSVADPETCLRALRQAISA